MLVAVLTLGIGYAALADELTITGSAGALADNSKTVYDEDIYFTKAVMNTENGNASIVGEDKDSATMTVLAGAVKAPGDQVIATFTIKSDSDLPSQLVIRDNIAVTDATPDNGIDDTQYFKVFTNWSGAQTLAANETIDIVVTVQLVKTPVQDVSCNFTLTLDAATAVQ
ncbi:MAG: hypothetical protein J6B60_04140 [Clostridia bacterium]|nr:hypothetical protein [Clostridia bacterium]